MTRTLLHVAVAKRVKDLRDKLRLSQESLAERASDQLSREEVNKIESGKNQATTAIIRAGLARAFGLTIEDLNAYLDETLDLPGVLRRRGAITANYARMRLRGLIREGRTFVEISRELGLDTGLLRLVWGGNPIGKDTIERWALALGFKDDPNPRKPRTRSEVFEDEADRWWREKGYRLHSLLRPENDPDEARAEAISIQRSFEATDMQILSALEANEGKTGDRDFWLKALKDEIHRQNIKLKMDKRDEAKTGRERRARQDEVARVDGTDVRAVPSNELPVPKAKRKRATG